MFFITVSGKQYALGVEGPDTPENRARAEEAARKLLQAVGDPVTVGDACARYLEAAGRRVGHHAMHGYRRDLKAFVAAVGADTPLASLTTTSVEATADRPGWSATTRSSYLAVVGAMLRESTGQPWKLRRPAMEFRGSDAIWTDEEFEDIHAAALGDFRPYLIVLRETGARPMEVASLTAEVVNWAEGLAALRKHKNARKGKPRVLHFSAVAMAELNRQRDQYPAGHLFRNKQGKPFRTISLCVRLELARARAFVERPVTLYGLRHGFITRALEAGYTADVVAALVGNSPQMISRVYSHVGANAALMRTITEKVSQRRAS